MATPTAHKSQRQPLVTPSTSPPQHQGYFPPPYRLQDGSPPSKRPRMESRARSASVPRPGLKSSTSATPDTELDIEKAREASARRLIDAWSSLAERYCKPMDEDDIVDLLTGKIVKNRGVLQGTRKAFKIGSLTEGNADETEQEADNGTESEYLEEVEGEGDEGLEEEEQEEDRDELDVLGKADAKKSRIQAIAAKSRIVPPVRKKDATDAEDLRDFLKAEKQRKLLSGEHEDESDDDPAPERDYASETDESADEEDLLPSTDAEEPPASQADTGYSCSSSPAIEIDSSSDDELNAWGHDEASAVYRFSDTVVPEDSDSEVEIVEPPHPISVRPPKPPKLLPPSQSPAELETVDATATKVSSRKPPYIPKSTTKPLPTPPLSHSSSSIPPPSTPLNEDSELPFFYVASSPLPPSSPPSSSVYGSSPIRPLSKTRSLPHITPKPPSTFRTRSNIDGTDATPVYRLDLSRVQRPRPKSTLKRQVTIPQSPSPTRDVPSVLPEVPFLAPTPPLDPPRPKTKVEVVIKPRKTPHKLPAQKRVEKRIPEVQPHSDEESVPATPESPPLPRPPPRIFKHPASPLSKSRRKPTASSESITKGASSPPQRPTTSSAVETTERTSASPSDKPRRKRKRVVSTEFVIEDEPVVEASLSARRPSRPMSPRPGSSRIHEPSGLSDPFTCHSSPGHLSYKRSQSYFETYPPFPSSDPGYFPPPPPPPQQQQQQQSYPGGLQHSVYPPLPDPRAQLILAQAMHQLHALYTSPWTPQRAATPIPYPSPQYYSHLPPVYATPTHTPHSYAYTHDSNASRETIPPETPSSPVRERRKTLVERSRSRGRRVSFKMEGDDDDHSDGSEPKRTVQSKGKGKVRASSADAIMASPSPEPAKTRSSSSKKGKHKAKAVSETDSDNEELFSPTAHRGRPFHRGQTPGPPINAQESEGRGRPPGRAKSKSAVVRTNDS
ncbi:hypothetical protein BDN72DRAFT_832982 [Pluteus cervinus]|uniref:Uncharacterized protein n=1 Tax=Pluteus cervinus TaxID=181527 RepID=A0ACD3BAK0_9AGAR|nr:hypothetical protein BDN72DRAFT_832982 [Pluteus cervinus]